MVRREVVSLHIGQAGVQIGTAFWELFLLEHCLDPDGLSLLIGEHSDTTFQSFFEDVGNNKFVPRTVFIDSESNVIDELKLGIYRNLFHPDQLLSGTVDGANNFARGSFTLGNRHMVQVLEKIRKSIEICDFPQGFLLNHSLSGGTGSGLTSVILNALSFEYSKIARVQMPIFPGSSLPSAIVEPYNCTFHVHTTNSCTDMAVLFDNESAYDICLKSLFMYSPNFSNVNRILALVSSAITASLRFEGVLNANLTDLLTNLIPYPRIHFPLVSHVPIMHKSRANHETITTKLMLKNIFSQEFQLMKCHLNRGLYMSIVFNGRGIISPAEINESIRQLKSKQDISFVEWSPCGIKLCLNNQIPSVVPESEMAFSEKALTMICNTTSIKTCWLPLIRRFDMLFEKRAYLHWFLKEGMEEMEFMDARNNLSFLIDDYNEIGNVAFKLVEDFSNFNLRSGSSNNFEN